MREPERQVERITLRLSAIADANQIELALEPLLTPVTILATTARMVPDKRIGLSGPLDRLAQQATTFLFDVTAGLRGKIESP
jgi:hypothetical protein